jgi:hypothetical protein
VRWVGAAAVLVLAGCLSAGPADVVDGARFDDFSGCHLAFPDGTPNPCRDERIFTPAPDWRLGICIYEGVHYGDWQAIVAWPAHGLFGLAADLLPGRQAVAVIEIGDTHAVLGLNETGQVAVPVTGSGTADGFLLVFEETLRLQVDGKEVPVRTVWQSWGTDLWAAYEADGHWIQNATTFTFLDESFTMGWAGFSMTGLDFQLNVTRLFSGQMNIWGQWPPVGRPCLGPDLA